MRWLPKGIAALWVLTAAPTDAAPDADNFDYIVVGSGAGGGVVASRLARAGYHTLLIESGDDQGDGSNANYTVPAFQGIVTDDPKMRWDIYVDHYDNETQARRDPKYVYDIGHGEQYVGLDPPAGATPLGILYPRASTLGGCVSHNALIYMEPHDSDWDKIHELTGDSSWSARNMDVYRDRVREWLPVNPVDPLIVLEDTQLAQHIAAGAASVGHTLLGLNLLKPVLGLLNLMLASPNARAPNRDARTGFFQDPLIMRNGQRVGVRDMVADTMSQGYPLTLWSHTLATKVEFDTTAVPPKATGVSYMQGAYLYAASPLHQPEPQASGTVRARKEVILAAGAFNTPQLLKLSGIGPADELAAFDIPLIQHLPGVGINLQDRYEIPVIAEHRKDFRLLRGCTLDEKPHDECYRQWATSAARGTYASNGLAALIVSRSSTADSSDTDLFTFGGPVNFQGYRPGWADLAVADHRHWAWYTLKAHTRNRAGAVTLRSADPRATPRIQFRYFEEGCSDPRDAEALVEAIKLSRRTLGLYQAFALLGGSAFVETVPGPAVQTDAQLLQFVKDTAWGHHASCTAAIGAAADPAAVLDAAFRVRGVRALRVVDASVFPQIPGSFLQSPIMIAAEKAADVILADA